MPIFSKLISLYELSPLANILIAGDFNCDPTKHQIFNLLRNSCEKASLYFCDIEKLPKSTFTYINDSLQATSWIDHLILSMNLKESVDNITVHPPSPSEHLIIS